MAFAIQQAQTACSKKKIYQPFPIVGVKKVWINICAIKTN